MIHGHEVLEMMQGHTYTMESLLKAIEEKFGADARFYTCHGSDMTAEELIQFFMWRGRIALSASGVAVQECDHHHEGGCCHGENNNKRIS